jgi:hypothetical protein
MNWIRLSKVGFWSMFIWVTLCCFFLVNSLWRECFSHLRRVLGSLEKRTGKYSRLRNNHLSQTGLVSCLPNMVVHFLRFDRAWRPSLAGLVPFLVVSFYPFVELQNPKRIWSNLLWTSKHLSIVSLDCLENIIIICSRHGYCFSQSSENE